MKEQIKASGKVQLSCEDIANLSDTQLKALVIRMLTEMGDCGCKIEGQMKAMKTKLRKNATNSDRKETKTQINNL